MLLATLLAVSALTAPTFTAPQRTPTMSPAESSSIFPFDGFVAKGGDVHDPSITLFGDKYFCFVTSGNSFSPIKVSSDLVSWTEAGPALAEAPDWLKKQIPAHRSVWAPMALKFGNEMRLYYCASEKFGANGSVIGVAVNPQFDPKNPTKGWKDLGKIVESKAGVSNFNAIDPDVLVDETGRHWMVYGSYWSGIYMQEMDPATGKIKDPEKPHFHVASNSADRANALEAPALAYHGGYYYLFVTYGLAAQGVRSTYRMVVGRSKDANGPYVGFDGKPMTEGGHTDVLKSSPPMFGPGGGNIFKGKDGDLYIAYHYYDGRRHWNNDLWGRPTIQVRKIVWGADGWPLPGLPEGKNPKVKSSGVEGVWIHQADFADPAKVTLLANGVIEGARLKGKWTLKGTQLVMEWEGTRQNSQTFIDTLTLDPNRNWYVGRNQAGRIIRGVRADVVKD